MRLAVNAEQFLYRSPGGIGRYTAQLLTVLPADFPAVEVVPFTARHPRPEVDAALGSRGVERRAAIQPWPRPALYEGWLRFGRPQLRGVGPVDLVHAPSVAVPPRQACPLVVTVHDAAPELFPDAFPRRGRRFHRRALEVVAERADLVITVSAAAADEIAAHTPIRSDRIQVVPNGIDPPDVAPEVVERVLAGYGLTGQPYVLWVGSLEPRKGVGTLVAAMAELHRRAPTHRDVQTVLCGFEGWLGSGLVGPGDRAALGSALRHLGSPTEEQLWALYRGATVFAFPSRHEGFGLPVVEAMSQETAVVASDIPSVREVAGEAAVLVRPGDVGAWADAIDGLLGDEAARARLARAGSARSRLFDVHRSMAGTYAAYQQILSTGCASS